MCTAATDEFMKNLVEEGDRAPAMHLVNTVLANFPEFAKTFNCAPNTKMNPTNRVEVW
jgi:predicted metalloendopeptidase